jgi:glycopeptide antibiotics resistance protein
LLIQFSRPIFTGLFLIWILYRGVTLWRRRGRYVEAPLEAETVLTVLFIYALMLVGLTLFPLAWNMPNQEHPSSSYNLEPFHMIYGYVEYAGFSRQTIVNIPGNIAAFFPLGLLLPLYRRRSYGFWKVLLIGFLVSCGVEIIQWTGFPFDRKLDVDDVILNTLGAAIGYAVARMMALPFLHGLRPKVTIWAPRSRTMGR